MRFWFDEIRVRLLVKNVRIGGAKDGEVDLGVLPLQYAASSIKGLLRKAAIRVSNSIGCKDLTKQIFGESDSEGKIQIYVDGFGNCDENKRFGIKIHPFLGSVEEQHLVSYKFMSLESLSFKIKPLLGLSEEEARLLLFCLNYLRYETLGGFGSRGIGLIEDVEVDDRFRQFLEEKYGSLSR
ncbi:MAG: RAMP superfamily CRISPR-associated protein [Archaeoglobaceae archaeon]